MPSALPGVFEAEPVALPLHVLGDHFDELAAAIARNDEEKVRTLLFDVLETNTPARSNAAEQPITLAQRPPIFAGASLQLPIASVA